MAVAVVPVPEDGWRRCARKVGVPVAAARRRIAPHTTRPATIFDPPHPPRPALVRHPLAHHPSPVRDHDPLANPGQQLAVTGLLERSDRFRLEDSRNLSLNWLDVSLFRCKRQQIGEPSFAPPIKEQVAKGT
jgi:hypothetical protein